MQQQDRPAKDGFSRRDNRRLEVQTPWAVAPEQVLKDLDVSPDAGLDGGEVERRRSRAGPNRMQQAKPQSAGRILINQFTSAIVLILIAAAATSFALGEIVDGFAIMAAVVVNTVIGFFMEIRAVRSTEALRQMERITARVLRDGQIQEIPADRLVPGDIVVMEGGDIAGADLRLIEASRARVNESVLTGESVPVDKQIEPLDRDIPLPERKNMLFKGTALTAGSCKGVVTATGMATELGRISSLVQESQSETTPLEKRLESLGRRLLWLTLAILVVVAAVGIARGRETFLLIETAVALAIAAIPEGLPIVATIAMARGRLRMARHNALINRLAAVETLGSTTVICTDKTGTLTENKMTVRRIVLDEAEVAVGAESKDGAYFFQDDKPFAPEDHEALVLLLEAGTLCNNASLGDGPQSKAVGDPLEVALLEVGVKAGLDRGNLREHYPLRRDEPFDPSVKRMATFHKTDEHYLIMVKGAPERVIEASTRVRGRDQAHPMTNDQRRQWNEKNLRLAEQGLRVLAIATKHVDSLDARPYVDLTLLGLVGMADPARNGVAVEEGRVISNNIRTFVVYLLSANASEILTVFAASLLNWPLPLLPLQILFLNVVNDAFPALALGVGKGGQGIMKQPPRNPAEPILTKGHWWSIFGYGGLITAPVLASLWIAMTVLKVERTEMVTISFLTLGFAQLWHIFNMRDADSGLVRNEITKNPYIWAALAFCTLLLLGAVYLPGISTVLELRGPSLRGWATILAMSLVPLVIGQILKTMRAPRP